MTKLQKTTNYYNEARLTYNYAINMLNEKGYHIEYYTPTFTKERIIKIIFSECIIFNIPITLMGFNSFKKKGKTILQYRCKDPLKTLLYIIEFLSWVKKLPSKEEGQTNE